MGRGRQGGCAYGPAPPVAIPTSIDLPAYDVNRVPSLGLVEPNVSRLITLNEEELSAPSADSIDNRPANWFETMRITQALLNQIRCVGGTDRETERAYRF